MMFNSNVDEVEEHWKLPSDLPKAVEGLSVHAAFKAFHEYLQRALGDSYQRDIARALRWHDVDALKKAGIRPTSISFPKDSDVDDEVGKRIRHRVQPFLPAVRWYVERRKGDGFIGARLFWLIDQIEAIPGAVEGLYQHPPDDTGETWFTERAIERWLWKEMRDGLVAIADDLTKVVDQPPADNPNSAVPPLRWLKGADLFGYLFRHLADHGYIEAPMKRKKGETEVHAEEFADRLVRLWDIDNGKGGSAAKSTLTTNLRRGASINANTVKKFLDDMAKEEKK